MTTFEYWRYLEEERFRYRVLHHKGVITMHEVDDELRKIREECRLSVAELTSNQVYEIHSHGDNLWDVYIRTGEVDI